MKPEAAAGSFEYDGRTYYFCSTHCLDKFRANPQGFLNQAQLATCGQVSIHAEPAVARSSDTETLPPPMHPDVR